MIIIGFVLTMADVDFEPYATVESLVQDMRDVVDGLWGKSEQEAPPAHEEPEPCEPVEGVADSNDD